MKVEIQHYISQFPENIQQKLLRIREILYEEVPDADEAIKYQLPTIIWHGNLIHYGAFKNHIGIYPSPNVLEQLKEEIKEYTTSKGAIQFNNVKELPEDLIRKIVIMRKIEKTEEINKSKV
ncbi:MAG TPA: hypothetical protein DC057_06170 [Spirochaetia bacterium]|nr:hypothetical protein [Spirochaetia bacterium]